MTKYLGLNAVPLTTLSTSNARPARNVAYLFRPLGSFFTDKMSQYRQGTRLLEH
jgi:hypothetical protein